jgi:PAS domain S-box-containing protein
MKILIAEDDERTRRQLCHELQGEGHAAFGAADGLEALKILGEQAIDVIVSDILMPRMDGYRLCHEVRATEQWCQVPFLFFTATFVSQDDETMASDVGADAFIRKPASSKEISRTIDALLARPLNRPPRPMKVLNESKLLRDYSERLVTKLEQKNIELNAAHEQLQLQATAVKTAANAVLITDKTGKIVWVNPAFTELTGYAADEAIGNTPRILKSGRHDAAFYKAFWATIGAGKTWRGQFINRRKDGRIFFDEHTVTPVCDADGKVTHFIGVLHDVTAREEAEKIMRHVHEELEQLLAHSPAVIYRLRIEGEKILPEVVSDNVERFLGVSASEAASEGWWQSSLHPDEREEVPATFTKALRRDHFKMEYRLRHKDGSYRWVEDNVRVLRDASAQPASIVGVWTDITERKQAEKELRESEARLRGALQFNRTIMDASPIGIVTYKASGEAISANRAAANLVGASTTEQLKAQNFRQLESWNRSDLREAAEKALLTNQEQEIEVHLVTTFNKQVSLAWRFVPFAYEGEQHLLALFHDIAERERLEGQLRQAQKMEAIGQLAGGVAHDFNNILTVIDGHAALLGMSVKSTSCESASIEQISDAAARAARLTRQLLTFSRKQLAQKKPLDINTVVVDITRMLHRVVNENITIKQKLQPCLPRVFADVGMLEQVLLNLVINSRDAMPNGGELIIETSDTVIDEEYTAANSEARPGHFLVLSVTDNGCGIRSEHLPRIFEPFFTTKEAGRGTGLGLATVYGIIKQHEGWIKVYSEVDHGTTLRVYVPAMSCPASVPQPEHRRKLRGGSETILLVEDEIQVRTVARAMLERFGYSVFDASTGAGALEMWAAHREKIDLLLTDMVMPGDLSGLELARRLQKECSELKVILASGYSTEFLRNGPAGRNGCHFLAKPYALEELLETIRESLDQGKAALETKASR